MKLASSQIRLSATDVSNHLACRHLTNLELTVARREREGPKWAAPDLRVIRELGLRHEAAYLQSLVDSGLNVVNLADVKSEPQLPDETLQAMRRGTDVIAQGALQHTRWFGRPDVLRKVPKPSSLGAWSYEAYDCKLARQTKATTILQLSFYSELLGQILGATSASTPEFMYVVVPGSGFQIEAYRVAEYAAYYRYVKAQLAKVSEGIASAETYPEPCAHCDVCRWWRECDAKRRTDDDLSLVAGIRRLQQNELEEWEVNTVAKLAVLPIPLKKKPNYGSREGLERVREQARVQVAGRTAQKPVHELILPIAEGMGFCRLPAPSPADLFVDLEGDPFVGESGFQYLFGLAYRDAGGRLAYEKRWALDRAQEKAAFEWLVDEIMHRRAVTPGMHVYHFGAYEPAALKRLMGMYATREDEIDRMLRAGVLVDLHQVFKQALRASVEEYSLKKLEAFYGFERKTPLDESRAAMRYIEHRMELGRMANELPESIRDAMEGYNSEDCFSTSALRDWVEQERRTALDQGLSAARFVDGEEKASEELDDRQKRVANLVARLTKEIPADPAERSDDQRAQWLLAQMIDWHRREQKATHWEGFRLADLDDQDLLDDRAGLAGLKFLRRSQPKPRISLYHYEFEKQETEARVEKDLYCKGEKFGTIVEIDVASRTVAIKKTSKSANFHPAAVYVWEFPYRTAEHAESLFRLGEWVASNGINAAGTYRAARDVLLRSAPRLRGKEKLAPRASEKPESTAIRIALALQDSTFAIQGPPGAGKTYTGARMICEFVKQGKKVGVTATGHKVIRNLLDEVVEAAREQKLTTVRCAHREDDGEESEGVIVAASSDDALQSLARERVNVLGGTSWLWSPAKAFETVDVLFIDEAGQMSLADVLAVAQSSKKLVLLGDPQQLERPLKGSHPDGAEKSALEHLLNGRKTIAQDMGFLLPETWRLHPSICKFTSEIFYDGKLSSNPIAQSRVLAGHSWLKEPGLYFVPVEHSGNRNTSPIEVEVVARIVESLLKPKVKWFYSVGNSRRLEEKDILIVAPYNAQVAELSERLPNMRIGTVDKFQGQEAPVIIYSLTTSSPEDAPRGMEFLYSLNRLNVATSRAMSNVILVGNPRLMQPECRSPRQMQLANALCRYAELAQMIVSDQV
jgi:predicted RecB family nuclease